MLVNVWSLGKDNIEMKRHNHSTRGIKVFGSSAALVTVTLVKLAFLLEYTYIFSVVKQFLPAPNQH